MPILVRILTSDGFFPLEVLITAASKFGNVALHMSALLFAMQLAVTSIRVCVVAQLLHW